MTKGLFAGLSMLCLLMSAAHAGDRRVTNADQYEKAVMASAGHPNEIERWHGIWCYDNGRLEQARKHFERAAYYGDKLSQHLLSLMYWNGEGVAREPVIAYVWADLAVERGTSQELLQIRESFWNALSPEQQERVRVQGPAYQQRYGDAVAQRRTNVEMGQFLRQRTGTRTGSESAPLSVRIGRPRLSAKSGGGGTELDMSQMDQVPTQDFYGAARTRPATYWQAEDRQLVSLVRVGNVHIGDVKNANGRPEGK